MLANVLGEALPRPSHVSPVPYAIPPGTRQHRAKPAVAQIQDDAAPRRVRPDDSSRAIRFRALRVSSFGRVAPSSLRTISFDLREHKASPFEPHSPALRTHGLDLRTHGLC